MRIIICDVCGKRTDIARTMAITVETVINDVCPDCSKRISQFVADGQQMADTIVDSHMREALAAIRREAYEAGHAPV